MKTNLTDDRLVGVVHSHSDSGALKLVDNVSDFSASISWHEGHFESTGAWDEEVSRLVLVAVSMTADDDWLLPAGNETRHVVADNRLKFVQR